ncbi:Hsp20/alpha crystallin family protein [Paraburkholderia adhaesiva]|uniref:Hsp20/alpha crystallin family protein n=1 Tax=Paraburkholderia adhaesiva TaxID=2883244 RepID=UPI001F445C9E|nr:Hsp20 family protein [Paraburkholderia adhaesiva]
MNYISRCNPFALEGVPDTFQGLFRHLRGTGGSELQQGGIRIDVTEGDAAYTVKTDLPGVAKNDIGAKIDSNLVSIAAKIERVLRREQYSGSVSRSFTHAADIGEAAISAQYKGGVLTLELLKKALGTRKRVEFN